MFRGVTAGNGCGDPSDLCELCVLLAPLRAMTGDRKVCLWLCWCGCNTWMDVSPHFPQETKGELQLQEFNKCLKHLSKQADESCLPPVVPWSVSDNQDTERWIYNVSPLP